ncbi:Hypothetical protein AA314_04322 [Archangium gephyra]|uniref:Uncharacterized protein n=1 Tax=Archangium gephyra TaxID=48 RepID=A0AAC8Q8A2_9BACT|nr:Hypothetical protein AA314_04322 [Archangium gephyra]
MGLEPCIRLLLRFKRGRYKWRSMGFDMLDEITEGLMLSG